MKRLFTFACGIIIMSCNSPATTIEGKWQFKDLATPNASDSTNFTAATLFALEAVPAFVDISGNHIYFKDKKGNTVDSVGYLLASADKIQVINGSDTASGKWKLENSELSLSFGKATYKLTRK